MGIRYALTLVLLASLGSALAQPFNNNPCQAAPLIPGENCQFQQFNNTGATNAFTGIPNPGCGGYDNSQAQTVWFVIPVPADGMLTIDQSQGSLNNTSMAAYSAPSCTGPFALIACDENSSANGDMPRLDLTGLVPGSLVYIRVWDYYAQGFLGIGGDPSQQGTFNICAQVSPVSFTGGSGSIVYDCGSTPAPGNTCDGATPICTFDGYCGSTQGYTANYWTALGGDGLFTNGLFCGSIENNSFTSFIAGASTVELEVIVSGSTSACGDGVQFMVFGDPNGPACNSTSIVDYGCESPMPPGANQFIANNLVPGLEYYMMVDGFAGDNCTYQINAVSGVVVDVSAGPDRSICDGGSVTLNVYGNGTGPVSWTGPGLNTTTGVTVIATPPGPGVYQYIVYATDALVPECNGQLSDTVQVTVAASTPITVDISPCVNGSYVLTASGATNYVWTPSVAITQTSGNSVTVTPTGPTTYTVTGATTGCIISTTVSVTTCDTNCNEPVFTVTAPAAVCSPATVNLSTAVTGNGVNTITYHASQEDAEAGTPALPSSTVSASGIYYVRVQVPGSPDCFSVQPIEVAINTAPVVDAGAAVTICAGASTTLTATGATTYAWSPATGLSATTGASVDANPSATTTYTVTGTTDGCSATSTVTVTVAAALVIQNTAVQPTCNGTNGSITISVTGGSTNLGYAWDSGETTATVSALAAGNYTVTVTDNTTNCTATETFSLSSAGSPAITGVVAVNPNCVLENGSINITATGGNGGLQYSVDGGDTFQATGAFTGLAAGSYDVMVADADGCSVADNAVLVIPASPTIDDVVSVEPTCNASNGSLVITATGGTGNLQYSVDNGDTFQNSGSFQNLPAGNYEVLIVDGNACTATINAPLNSENAPSILAVDLENPNCIDDNGTITIEATGGIGVLTYSIDGGTTTSTTFTYTGLAAGAFAVTVEDEVGCIASENVTLIAPIPADITLTGTSPSCGGSDGTITINTTGGNGAMVYSIDNGASGQASGSFTGVPAGSYDILVLDAEGCQSIGVTTLLPLPVLNSVEAFICQGESFFVGGAPQTTSGDYENTYLSVLGCDSIVTTTLTVHPLPPAGFVATPMTAPVSDPNFVVIGGPGTGITEWVYDWGDGTMNTDPSGTHTYDGAGRYTITQTVTSANGCVNSFALTVVVREDLRFYIPNAFTPDGDGVNDFFAGYGVGFTEWEMLIFDRWGELIHTTTNTGPPWDGRIGGKDAAQSVYPYRCRVVDQDGIAYEYLGHVTLTR